MARLVTVVAPLLGLGAFALLAWGKKDAQSEGAPELAVWQLLITAQVVAWTVLAGAGLRALRELNALFHAQFPKPSSALRERWRKEPAWFLAFTYAVIGLLLVLGGVAGLRNPLLLPGQEWKIPLLHVVAGAATVPFFVALKRIQLCASENTGWSTSTVRDIEHVHFLRRYLRTATASLGTIIALAVIASGALNHAVEAAELIPLPESFVLVYGAWFSGVLAAIYLYVFTALEGRARSIMERAAPLPEPDLASAETFTASTKLRNELTQLLELGGDPRKNLEGLIAVLSPLVGALLSLGGLHT